jgi:acetoin utilization protein AcuB
MKIRDVMRRGAFTIAQSETVGEAHRVMTRNLLRHLPVVHDGRLVGMVSERDILRVRAHADNGEWWRVPVEIVMVAPVHTAGPDDSLTEIACRLAAEKIGALPVVERGKVLGIVTVTDVLEAEVRLAMAPELRPDLVAADAMTSYPVTVHPSVLASDAVRIMVRARIRHLPVIDEGENVVGIVSDEDARTIAGDPTVFARGRSAAQPRVADIMATTPTTVRFDARIRDLARRFADERLEVVLVTDAFGALVGILSYVDLLRALAA